MKQLLSTLITKEDKVFFIGLAFGMISSVLGQYLSVFLYLCLFGLFCIVGLEISNKIKS